MHQHMPLQLNANDIRSLKDMRATIDNSVISIIHYATVEISCDDIYGRERALAFSAYNRLYYHN